MGRLHRMAACAPPVPCGAKPGGLRRHGLVSDPRPRTVSQNLSLPLERSISMVPTQAPRPCPRRQSVCLDPRGVHEQPDKRHQNAEARDNRISLNDASATRAGLQAHSEDGNREPKKFQRKPDGDAAGRHGLNQLHLSTSSRDCFPAPYVLSRGSAPFSEFQPCGKAGDRREGGLLRVYPTPPPTPCRLSRGMTGRWCNLASGTDTRRSDKAR